MLWRPELTVWQLRVLLYCGSCGHVLSQAAQRDHKVKSRSLTARRSAPLPQGGAKCVILVRILFGRADFRSEVLQVRYDPCSGLLGKRTLLDRHI